METALRPQAREEKHPTAFYKHWLLAAIDGTQFSATNTPQILSSLSKATSRRMKAAFAKVGLAVLVELGVHNPLAAEIAQNEESEMGLSKRLLARLPANSLLIWDRYHGVGAFLGLLCGKVPGNIGGFSFAGSQQLGTRSGQAALRRQRPGFGETWQRQESGTGE